MSEDGRHGHRSDPPAGAGLLIIAAGSLAAVPHTMVILIIAVVGQFTQIDGPFALPVVPLTTLAHLTATAAALVGALWMLRRRRLHRCRQHQVARPTD